MTRSAPTEQGPSSPADPLQLVRMIQVFSDHDPDAQDAASSRGNLNIPQNGSNDYTRNSWPVIKAHLLDKGDEDLLYDLAIRMRKDILREELQNPKQEIVSAQLLDVYTTIHELHSQVEAPRSQPINPYNDFIDFVLLRGGGNLYWKTVVFSRLHDLAQDLDMPTDEGRNFLTRLCEYIRPIDPYASSCAATLLHTALSCGLPSQEVFSQASPRAQEIIRKHPSYIREKLNAIAKVEGIPSHRRPGM